ncbi:MAG TPA: hypothetical protein VM093_07990 [Aeromicrobium sp.]|nr:hypothetical protein [Aeromicrobium sp.]
MNEDPPKAGTPPRLDRRQLGILLGVWAATAVIPGIITVDRPVMLAYVVWGIGFIASLALFITIAQITKTTEMWPWLAAPVLPWVVDIAVPHSWLWIPVVVIATGAFAVWLFRGADIADRLLHEGVPGTGTVLGLVEPRFAGAVVNDGFVRRGVRLQVERPDKAKSYEAVLRDVFRADRLPQPGDTIDLQVDPKDATRVVKRPEPATTEPTTPGPTTPEPTTPPETETAAESPQEADDATRVDGSPS